MITLVSSQKYPLPTNLHTTVHPILPLGIGIISSWTRIQKDVYYDCILWISVWGMPSVYSPRLYSRVSLQFCQNYVMVSVFLNNANFFYHCIHFDKSGDTSNLWPRSFNQSYLSTSNIVFDFQRQLWSNDDKEELLLF